MKLPIGSYSFFNTVLICPHQAYRRYVARDIPRVETPEMAWGNEVHSAFESRLRNGASLPENLMQVEPLCQVIDPLLGQVEYKLAIDIHGEACTWDKAWFRGKIDYVAIYGDGAWFVDWKTGKPREEPLELECQALLLQAHYPKVKTFIGEYYWLKEGRPGVRYTLDPNNAWRTIVRIDIEIRDWQKSGGPWPKKKGPLCGWCDVMDCEHNTKVKQL